MNPAHLDYDTLADLAEGLLEDDQAASVNAHLDGCAECRDRSADLADVSRILAEAPAPPLPSELAARIDTAIAAEALNGSTVASLEARRGRRHWRILSAAAAAVVVLGGGAMVGTMAVDDSQDGAQSGALRTPLHDASKGDATSGERAVPKGAAPEASEGATLNAQSFTVTRSGTDYRTGTLGEQVDRLMGRDTGPRTGGSAADRRLAGCVSGLLGSRSPDLVDDATFEGRQATVIASRGNGTGAWSVWVVGPDCTARDPHLLKREQTGS